MRYKTFRGKTRQAAFAQLNLEKKNDPCLRDARLIKHSEGEVSSFLGLKKESIYEIIVGIPEHSPKITQNSPAVSPRLSPDFTAIEKSVIKRAAKTSDKNNDTLFAFESVSRVAEQISKLQENPSRTTLRARKNTDIKAVEPPSNELINLKKEMSEIRDLCHNMLSSISKSNASMELTQKLWASSQLNTLPDDMKIHQQHLRWLEQHLRKKEFSHFLTNEILEYVQKKIDFAKDKQSLLDYTKEFLLKYTSCSQINLDLYPFASTILLLGTSGVGKTVSLAKMAAHMALMRQKSFSFLSLNYTFSGISNLERMAQYMDVPFYDITQKEDLAKCLETSEKDFIFIDTPGQSIRDEDGIKKLFDWISIITKPLDIHLVVNATTKNSDLNLLCDLYSIFNINHILVTKADETETFGPILSLAYRYKKPLSFFSDGQEIPQNFSILDLNTVIDLSLK